MTVLNRTPINTSYLQPTKFLLMLDRVPNTQYFCQTANIPGVSLGQATFSTPRLDFNVVGTKLSYSEFNINNDIPDQVIRISISHDYAKWIYQINIIERAGDIPAEK